MEKFQKIMLDLMVSMMVGFAGAFATAMTQGHIAVSHLPGASLGGGFIAMWIMAGRSPYRFPLAMTGALAGYVGWILWTLV